MRIELRGDWYASCDVMITFKGKTFKAYWTSEEGYALYDIDALDTLTDDECDALSEQMKNAPTPSLSFDENGPTWVENIEEAKK